MRLQREAQLREQIAWWLKAQFPGVLFRFDPSSDIKLTIPQANRLKRLGNERGFPDLQLLEPRAGFAGAFFELKAEGAKLYRPNGELYADKHLDQQSAMLNTLRAKGYYADFAQGFDEAVEKISAYLLAKVDNS